VKSTVIPGSTEDVITPVLEDAIGKTAGEEFGTGMNPEFLREGTAVHDFLDPDKVVLGADDDRALADMHDVFDPLVDAADAPVVETDTWTGDGQVREQRVSRGESQPHQRHRESLQGVRHRRLRGCRRHGAGRPHRRSISPLGARLEQEPKDTHAIINAASEERYDPAGLEAVVEVNDRQPERLLSLLYDHVDDAGERVAVLGLAFKPGTDDVRNSRALPVIEGLRERGANVVAYDPVADENMRKYFPNLDYASQQSKRYKSRRRVWSVLTGTSSQHSTRSSTRCTSKSSSTAGEPSRPATGWSTRD